MGKFIRSQVIFTFLSLVLLTMSQILDSYPAIPALDRETPFRILLSPVARQGPPKETSFEIALASYKEENPEIQEIGETFGRKIGENGTNRFSTCFSDFLDLQAFLYTEQMDAEGLGRKLLLTPPGDP